MESVKHNKEFCFKSPKTNETLRKVNARELWQKNTGDKNADRRALFGIYGYSK